MTIYGELVNALSIKPETKFKVDFYKKTLKIGNRKLIDNGEWNLDNELIDFINEPVCNSSQDTSTMYCLNIIEELYKQYKYSNPSKESESFRDKTYFKALPENELTMEQRVTEKPRNQARAALEAFILCASLAGYLVWDDEIMGGHWYYQGKDKDLVIMREWIDID